MQTSNMENTVTTCFCTNSCSSLEWQLSYLEDLILVWLEGMQLQFQVSQVPKSNSLWGDICYKPTAHILYFCRYLEFSHSFYLVCRARGKDELAVRVKRQTVDLCCVGIYCMAGFGGVVRSSVPTEEKNDIPQRFSYNLWAEHLPVRCDFITKPFTSWASGHLRQIQIVTREASARKRLQQLQYDRWRWSLHPLPSPPLAQHWCPTDRRSKKDKTQTGIFISLYKMQHLIS